MDAHPLATALSSAIPISPSFIYLHHPYHSSGYALPAEIDNESGIRDNSTDPCDTELVASGAEQLRRLTVKVDLGALSGEGRPTPSISTAIDAAAVPLSQKLFYNAVLREAFAGIINKVAVLKARRSKAHETDGTGTTPQKTQKNSKRKSTRGVNDPFDAAVLAFEDKFTPLARKDVYRWDVFLTRIRHMVDAFGSIVAAYTQASETIASGFDEELRVSMIFVVMESQLLQKCLGATWHALLRLNEMVESFHITVVLCSLHAWDDIKPMTGDAPEPYHLFLREPSKNETLLALSRCNSHPLFPYFLDLVYTACCHLIPMDVIRESERLAATLWQIYMLPVEGFRHREEQEIARWNGQALEDHGTATSGTEINAEPLQITYQLLTDLKNQSAYAFASANESLLPNRISASRFLDVFTGERKRKRKELEEEMKRGGNSGEEMAWFALANQVRQEQRQQGHTQGARADPIMVRLANMPATKPPIPKPAYPRLPLYAKYLILAAYCASYNSPRTDLRMFGRGPLTLRGKTRRSGLDGAGSAGRGYEGSGSAGKKSGAGLKKVKTLGKVGKVPQGLLGPKSFPLERMLAIFQSLLAEHGFREDLYDSDDLSDSDSGSESEGSEQGENGNGMDLDGTDDVLNSPTRRKRNKTNGTAKGMLDFSVVDDESKRIDRKRRKENAKLRSWEEEVEEISRSVGLFGLIRELEALRLLNRMSPKDRLDNILIRCEAPKEMVFEFARQVKVDLTTYLVEGE